MSEPALRAGAVAPGVASEFPNLALYWMCAPAPADGRSKRELRPRLRHLADRFRGPEAIAMRSKDIPWAHRVFFRHIGLDPDTTRTPVEEVALARLRHGGLRSHSILEDARTIAVMETGVGVWALDLARAADGGLLEIREGEHGRLVVGCGPDVVAPLFGDVAEEFSVTAATREIVLFAVAVPGVPDLVVEEALWTVADALGE